MANRENPLLAKKAKFLAWSCRDLKEEITLVLYYHLLLSVCLLVNV